MTKISLSHMIEEVFSSIDSSLELILLLSHP